MRPIACLTASSTARVLVVSVLLFVILAGCGGGDRANTGSQDGNASDETGKQDAGPARREAPERKIALGMVTKVKSVESNDSRIILRANEEMQGDTRMAFKLAKKAKITLNGEAAEVADVKRGQQAQIEYVSKDGGSKDRPDRAVAVQLFSVQE